MDFFFWLQYRIIYLFLALSHLNRIYFTLARAWCMDRLKILRKSIPSSYCIGFRIFLYCIIILSWTWIFSLQKDWDCFNILSTQSKWNTFFWTFFKIWWLFILIWRRIWLSWCNIHFFTKTNRCSSLAKHGRKIIYQITAIYIKSTWLLCC